MTAQIGAMTANFIFWFVIPTPIGIVHPHLATLILIVATLMAEVPK